MVSDKEKSKKELEKPTIKTMGSFIGHSGFEIEVKEKCVFLTGNKWSMEKTMFSKIASDQHWHHPLLVLFLISKATSTYVNWYLGQVYRAASPSVDTMSQQPSETPNAKTSWKFCWFCIAMSLRYILLCDIHFRHSEEQSASCRLKILSSPSILER